MNFRTPLAAAALVLIASVAHAQTPATAASSAMPRVDARAAEQQQRIQQGVASGALTPRETQRLEKEQRTIAKAERHAKADGVITPSEVKHLDRMQDKASRHIAKEKHDAQTTAPAVTK